MWTCKCHSQGAPCIGEAAGGAGSGFSEMLRACSAIFQIPWMLGCLPRVRAELGGGQKLMGKGYVEPLELG